MILFLGLLMPLESMALECIAHRGFSSSFPDNTIEAMTQAWDVGANIVELDVRILADNTMVLFHDKSIADVNTGSLSYTDLQKLTPNYHVPTLDEALDSCSPNHTLLLDLKGPTPKFIDRLLDVIGDSRTPIPRLIFQSRQLKVLDTLSQRLEQPTLFFVTSLKRTGALKKAPDPEQLSTILADHNIAGISAKGRRFIDREFVATFQEKGLAFYVWTINPVDRMEHYKVLGVDGIITDYPNLL